RPKRTRRTIETSSQCTSKDCFVVSWFRGKHGLDAQWASMRIAVPRESAAGERRVALVPESIKKLIQAGYEVSVEAGAGDAAGFPDAAYTEVGTTLESSARPLIASADPG